MRSGHDKRGILSLLNGREVLGPKVGWNHRGSRFGRAVQMHGSFIPHLGLERPLLTGHDGCVNAIAWNSSGSLLLSGSDDKTVKIWDYPTRQVLHSIESGHVGNIFDVVFMPGSGDNIIASGAADRLVRVHRVDHAVHWDSATSETFGVYNCHTGRVKKLAVDPSNGSVIWSAGEDGTLRQHDMRELSGCRRESGDFSPCRSVLLDLHYSYKKSLAAEPRGRFVLKSCAISPTQPHYLVVGGSDTFGRLYDRRMLSSPSTPQNSRPAPVVCYYAPMHLAVPLKHAMYRFGSASLHLTNVSFNPLGSEVLLNYSGEHVYCMGAFPGSTGATVYTVQDLETKDSLNSAGEERRHHRGPAPAPGKEDMQEAGAAGGSQRESGSEPAAGGEGAAHSSPSGKGTSSSGGGTSSKMKDEADETLVSRRPRREMRYMGMLHHARRLVGRDPFVARQAGVGPAKDMTEAVDLCTDVLENGRDDVSREMRLGAHLLRARALHERNWKHDDHMAVRDCNAARAMEPSSAEAHAVMAECLEALGQHKLALQFALHAQKLDKNYAGIQERIHSIQAAAEEEERSKRERARRQRNGGGMQLRATRSLAYLVGTAFGGGDEDEGEEDNEEEAEEIERPRESRRRRRVQHEAGPSGERAEEWRTFLVGEASEEQQAGASTSGARGPGGEEPSPFEGGVWPGNEAELSPSSARGPEEEEEAEEEEEEDGHGGGGAGEVEDEAEDEGGSGIGIEIQMLVGTTQPGGDVNHIRCFMSEPTFRRRGAAPSWVESSVHRRRSAPSGRAPAGGGGGAAEGGASHAAAAGTSGGRTGMVVGQEPKVARRSEASRAVDMRQRYVGHSNLATDIKQASFLGARGEFVASGSDDGRWFIWDKVTGRLLHVMAGDDSVVNCIQAHPFDCCVATGGIDYSIKLWTPREPEASVVGVGVSSPEVADATLVMDNNQRRLQRARECYLPLEFLRRLRENSSDGTVDSGECTQS